MLSRVQVWYVWKWFECVDENVYALLVVKYRTFSSLLVMIIGKFANDASSSSIAFTWL